ncbi:MAG: helix-turn-helix domain-containing protein [Bacillota bacterium]
MPIGSRIVEKRKEKGLSQELLAQRLGVSASYISQVETGVKNPSYGLLQGISHELGAPVDYFVGGEVKGVEDQIGKTITSIIPFIGADKKKRLLEYLFFLTDTGKYFDWPFFDSPVDYAQYVLRKHRFIDPPIDPIEVAWLLGVRVVESRDISGYEGMLYKSGPEPLIIVNPEITHEPRRKFTVAMMLGHLVIPWHVGSIFYRSTDKKSLDEEDQFKIQAREFAGALLVPMHLLKKDFREMEKGCGRIIGLADFERLASEKYKVSTMVIMHKYLELNYKMAALITSSHRTFTRKYVSGFPYDLVDEVMPGSLADSLVESPPTEKEIRKGIVDADVWLKNPPRGIGVYEESLFDPKFGVTMTILRVLPRTKISRLIC